MRKSISYELRSVALKGLTDRHTISIYKSHIKQFEKYCKLCNISKADLAADPKGILQRYSTDLQASGYAPASIHSYLAPVCKGMGIHMQDIAKPRRTAANITRSRQTGKNMRGDKQQAQERFSRLTELQSVVGIRRSELARLTKADLIRDNKGNLIVHVARGKGGKEQMQRVLPQHEQIVQRIFADVSGEYQRIFSTAEMTNDIDLHALRAEHARDCYEHYLHQIQSNPIREQQLQQELIEHFNAHHKFSSPADRQRAYKCFLADLQGHGGVYQLRGDNKQRALAAGQETSYNRTALMAVSVWHLSHWRLGVTVVNYMVK